MAQQEQVLMENIKNPSIKRYFTPASARQQTRKWRIVNAEVVQQVKKKDVDPAVEKAVKITPAVETVDSFNNEFATIGEEKTEKELLQAEYEELSGAKPDGRWNEGKLKEKIEALKTPA